jgi:hypothetical protein
MVFFLGGEIEFPVYLPPVRSELSTALPPIQIGSHADGTIVGVLNENLAVTDNVRN